MNVFITGATSGIGWAVAKKYLARGARVGVCGRHTEKISNPAAYPLLTLYRLDVEDKEALRQAVADFVGEGTLDVMILAAGSYADDSLESIGYAESTEMLRVNIAGAVNSLEVAREAMAASQGGRIAVVASVSGLVDHCAMTTYAATKRALIEVAKAYRRALRDFGITVTVVAPGYVDTPRLRELSADDLSRKPFVVSCQYAADRIVDGIDRGREMVVFPPHMKRTFRLLTWLPSWLVGRIMHQKAKWMQRK